MTNHSWSIDDYCLQVSRDDDDDNESREFFGNLLIQFCHGSAASCLWVELLKVDVTFKTLKLSMKQMLSKLTKWIKNFIRFESLFKEIQKLKQKLKKI